MAFDPAKPNMNAGQTMTEVIDSARANLVDLDGRVTSMEGSGLAGKAAEIVAARGSKADLNSRLSTSLDAAGNLRFAVLAALPVATLGDTPTYMTASTFRVPGNRTGAYPAGALVRLTSGGVDTFVTVASTTYDAGNAWTVVTTSTAVVPVGVSALALVPIAINFYGDSTRDFAAKALTLAAALNEAKGDDIASATTTDIGAATGTYVVVTGTATINSFGTAAAGTRRIVEFSGAGTITNSANVILPGGANITRAAGDVAILVSKGSGVWKCASYTKAAAVTLGTMASENVGGVANTLVMSGKAINEAKAGDLASAATTDIGAVDGNYVVVTGTVTITSFGTAQAGIRRIVEFSGTGTITNSANVILPGGANITRAAGDVAILVSKGGGIWKCTSYVRANGKAVVESVPVAALTKSYTSGQQTITSGSVLTLAHGLGAMPSLVAFQLYCVSAEQGYSAGDTVQLSIFSSSLVIDATNITLRYANTSSALVVFNKSTGAQVGITNGNWRLIVKAFA